MPNEQQQQSLTPEEFKLRVLKSRFAERTVELEEQIATLLTNLAQLEAEVQQYRQQEAERDANVDTEEATEGA